MKTAFEFCLENRKDIDGVVTVDGDNQHRAKDIKKCSETMVSTGNVVLGVRILLVMMYRQEVNLAII